MVSLELAARHHASSLSTRKRTWRGIKPTSPFATWWKMSVFAASTRTPTLLLSRTLRRQTLCSPTPRISILNLKNMSTKSLTAAIKDDHEEMYEYYDNYKKATGDAAAQGRWARQLTWEIARHAVGEEIVVYPLMEQHMGAEGKRLADEDREDHIIVKKLLNELESLTPGTESYDTKIGQVMEHLRPHNDSEEQKDLPQLEPKIGSQGSEAAALSFKRTKKFVPTRTHPELPNKPPYETLAGFLVLPIDKLKDMFAEFPTEEDKEAAKQ